MSIEIMVAGFAVGISIFFYKRSKTTIDHRQENIKSTIYRQFRNVKQSLDHHITRIDGFLEEREFVEREWGHLNSGMSIHDLLGYISPTNYTEKLILFQRSEFLLELDPTEKELIDEINLQLGENNFSYRLFTDKCKFNIEIEKTREKFDEEMRKILVENKKIHVDSLSKLNSILECIDWLKKLEFEIKNKHDETN